MLLRKNDDDGNAKLERARLLETSSSPTDGRSELLRLRLAAASGGGLSSGTGAGAGARTGTRTGGAGRVDMRRFDARRVFFGDAVTVFFVKGDGEQLEVLTVWLMPKVDRSAGSTVGWLGGRLWLCCDDEMLKATTRLDGESSSSSLRTKLDWRLPFPPALGLVRIVVTGRLELKGPDGLD